MNAIPFPLPSRRTLAPPVDFASLHLVAPVEAGAAKAAELDGELLACCAAAVEADAAAERCMDGLDCLTPDDPAYGIALRAAEPFLWEYEAAIGWASRISVRTPEGLVCKARLLLHVLASGCDAEALAGSLARDVVGRG